MIFDGMHITLDVDSSKGAASVSRITLAKHRCISPYSSAYVRCSMDHKLTDTITEPLEQTIALNSRVLKKSISDPALCIINPTHGYMTYKKGTEIGREYPISNIKQVRRWIKNIFTPALGDNGAKIRLC
jgi:hypothetical protein